VAEQLRRQLPLYHILIGNPEGNSYWEELDVEGRIIM
jgi:hypothetical protein